MSEAQAPSWTTACPDWAARIVAGDSLIPAPIYPDSAQKALDVFKRLRIPDLAGKPTFGEVSEQWVFDFVAAIFGAYEQHTGRQLVSEYFLLISKKNTKSTLSGGIMLTALILCWREEEEHLIIAPTKEVADASYNAAAGMVRADEELSAMFSVRDHIKTIEHRTKRNTLKVTAADSKTATGKKAGRILIDEIHEFGKMASAETVFTEATGGMVSRPEGFVIMLTTQSAEPPAGVFRDRLHYARRVRDGEIEDNTFLPVLYEYPPAYIEGKLYLDPENFYITNPNLGRSVSKQWLTERLAKAQAMGREQVQNFISKHLNVEIGLAARTDNWAGAEFWEAQAVRPYGLAELLERSEVVTVGIDGGGLDDLLGLYVLGREKETGHWLGWGYAWAHEIALERNKENTPTLRGFAMDNELAIVARPGEDVEAVADIVEQCEASGLLFGVGCDPAGIGAIIDKIEARGVPSDKLHGVSQGWRLGSAVITAERKLAGGEFTPARQGLMAWCVSNARLEQRANSILVTKQASGKSKIDPLMALFNATHLMATNPSAQNGGIVFAVLG